MKTKTEHRNNNHNHNSKRRGRENPSRSIPVGDWDAEVNIKSRGPNRADTRRKVKTNGIREFYSTRIADIIAAVRRGYEVRVIDDDGHHAVRFYPCLDADYACMFIAAQTMGNFRHSLSDIPFRMMHCGEEVSGTEAERDRKNAQARLRRENDSRVNVTPDTVVTCPECGTEFRVGKVLK